MSVTYRTRRLSVACVAVLSLASVNTSADPLSLEKALQLAEGNAPALAAQNHRIEAARQASIPAGALPDPKLVTGLESLPVTGTNRFSLTRDNFTMWRLGVMQEVPNRDKRKARIAAAESQLARSEAQREVERLNVRKETAAAWLKRFIAERKLTVLTLLDRENQFLLDAVHAKLAGGGGLPADAIAPRQEVALLAERRDDVVAEREQAIAALRRWIGPNADAPLAGPLPDWPIDRTTLMRHLHHHPVLAALEPQARLLNAEISEARAAKIPDWSWEVDYQKRDDRYGDLISLQFKVDLPLFATHRQDPLIAAKHAERSSLDDEREAMTREHIEQLEADLADDERLRRAVKRQRDSLLPLAREKAELILSAYRIGKTELSAVINARREHINEQLKLIQLEGQQSQIATRLHLSYGEQYE
jgi:outer membrane protein, heavy metal efflux system